MPDSTLLKTKRIFSTYWLSSWGPGLLVMLADCDAGNVLTAAQSGAQSGYRLVLVLLCLIPLLYMMQELAVRLGIFTGKGHGELIREYFGPRWAWLSACGLVVAVISSLVTEFTGVAGVGEMYGISRSVSLPLAVAVLIGLVLTGSHKKMHKVAIVIGAFELTFFAIAWKAHPDIRHMMQQATDLSFRDHRSAYMVAALIGATFNPWMVFYQQAAVVDKGLGAQDYRAARVETGVGAILTQLITASILIAVAATLSRSGTVRSLQSVNELSAILSSVMGPFAGRDLFGLGLLGASMVAAVVCSLSLAWGLGEVAGYKRSLQDTPARAPWFYAVYVISVAGSAYVVWLSPDLFSLNIAAQVANALMLPLVFVFLVALSVIALAPKLRPDKRYVWLMIGGATLVCVAGILGVIFNLPF